MKSLQLATPLLAASALMPAASWAAPVLGPQLSYFSVLGASAVTNTGNTYLSGNLGVSNTSAVAGITGFFGTLANDGPGHVGAGVQQGNVVSVTADHQLSIAMTSLGLMGPGIALGADLTGRTLTPGVYTVDTAASNLAGTLTLDGGGSANAYWVFQMPSTLITSPGAMVNVIHTGSGAGVFWNVGSSATLASGSVFEGNILAGSSITFNDRVSLRCGRALAHAGAVTLINDTIDSNDCAQSGAKGSAGLSGGLTMLASGGVPTPWPFGAASPMPEPASISLFAGGLGAIVFFGRRRRRSAS